jgi:nucleotide-binding universal stress UspA family protein
MVNISVRHLFELNCELIILNVNTDRSHKELHLFQSFLCSPNIKTMKRILVPTDFSDCANNAVNLAIKLAKTSSAEIDFIHTLYTPLEWVKLPLKYEVQYPDIKANIGSANNELNKLVRKAERAGIQARALLVFDSGREEIEKYAKSSKYDLVVMGSHGVMGTKEIIGSNAQKVMRYSKVPVFVVKGKQTEMKQLVFASDFGAESHKGFKKVLEFAALSGAKIHLLFVNVPYMFKETEHIDKLMNAFVAKYPKQKFTVATYNALSEERGIRMYSSHVNADVIAMVTHGKSTFTQLFTPSITETVANHSDISVLAIHISE